MRNLFAVAVLGLGFTFAFGTMACSKSDNKKRHHRKRKHDKDKKDDTKPATDTTANTDTPPTADTNEDTPPPPTTTTTPPATTTTTTEAANDSGEDEPPPPVAKDGTPDAKHVAKAIRRSVDRVCKCKDVECARRHHARLQRWTRMAAKKIKDSKKRGRWQSSMMRKYRRDLQRSAKCVARLAKSSPANGGGHAAAKMTELAAKMCACKNARCAKKVNKELMAWGKKGKKRPHGDLAAYKAAQKRYTRCFTKVSRRHKR